MDLSEILSLNRSVLKDQRVSIQLERSTSSQHWNMHVDGATSSSYQIVLCIRDSRRACLGKCLSALHCVIWVSNRPRVNIFRILVTLSQIFLSSTRTASQALLLLFSKSSPQTTRWSNNYSLHVKYGPDFWSFRFHFCLDKVSRCLLSFSRLH